MLSLSSSLGFLVILVDFLFPLLTSFNLFFEPTQDQWLFEFNIWIDWCKVLCCSGLLFAMLVVPVKDLNPLS
jgi:hypothetical protein